MEGAFNEAVGDGWRRAQSERAVIDALDRVLEPYGGRGAYGRDRHQSHEAVIGELEQNRITGTLIPAIFLGVAAFLLSIVLAGWWPRSGTEIGVLKAFGYTTSTSGGTTFGSRWPPCSPAPRSAPGWGSGSAAC
jgi:putative ABC transport system permease protein